MYYSIIKNITEESTGSLIKRASMQDSHIYCSGNNLGDTAVVIT